MPLNDVNRAASRSAGAARTVRVAVVLVAWLAVVFGILVLTVRWVTPTRNSEPYIPEDIRVRLRHRQAAIEDASSAAATRFDAVIGWDRADWRFTETLRNALIRADGRPVFFVGSLRDVDVASGGHVVTIDVGSPVRIASPALRFRLFCEAPSLGDALKAEPGLQVVGVAAISSLQMLRDTRNSIAPVLSDREYLASGRCLDFRALPLS